MHHFIDKYGNEFEEIEGPVSAVGEAGNRHEIQSKKSRRFAIFVVIVLCLVIVGGATITFQFIGKNKGGLGQRWNHYFPKDRRDKNRPKYALPARRNGDFANPQLRPANLPRTIVPLDNPIKKEFDVFFKKFLDTIKSKDQNGLSQYFDFEEIVKTINENTRRRHLKSALIIEDSSKIKKGYNSVLIKNETLKNIVKFDLNRIYRVGTSDRYLIYAEVSFKDDLRIMEFLIQRKGSQLRLISFSNSMLGLDTLTLFSEMMILRNRGEHVWRRALENLKILSQSSLAISRNRLDDAEKQLAKFDRNFSTRNISAYFYRIEALLDISREDFENALSDCERIKELLDSTPPIVHYLLSESHRRLGHYDAALKSAKLFSKEFGEDSLGLRQLALAQFYSSLKEQAAQTAKKSLDKNPDWPELVYVIGSSGKKTSKEDFSHYLLKLKQNEENYREIFDMFVEDRNYEMLDIAVLEFEKKFPSNPVGKLYRGKTLFEQEKYQKIIDLLEPILARVGKREDAWDFEELYFNALYNLDPAKAVDAYPRSQKPATVFEYLGLGLIRDELFENLKHLMALHRKKNPDDPALHRFQGELAFHNRQWNKAFAELFLAYQRENSDEQDDAIRKKIFEAAYWSDDVLSYYQKWDDKKEFFEGVSKHFRISHDPANLERLYHAYKDRFDTQNAIYYKALISVAQRKFETAAQILESRPQVSGADSEEKKNTRELYLQLMLRLGRIEEGFVNTQHFDESMVYLGNRLTSRKNISGLEQLISSCRQKNASYYYLDYYEGKLAELKGDWDKASDYFRAGYIATHDAEVYLDDLANALYQAKRPMEVYYLVKEKRKAFSKLAAEMAKDKNWTALNTLTITHKKDFPDDLNLAKYEAKNLIAHHRNLEAFNLLSPLLQRDTKKISSSGLMDVFAKASVKAGKTIEAYRQQKEKKAIYESLIGQLLAQKKYDDIRHLVEEHRKNQPRYPWLAYHLGRAQEGKKEWSQSVEYYRKGYREANPSQKMDYRSDLIRAEFFAGDALKILDEFPEERSVYEQLANLAYREEIITKEETIRFLETLIQRWKKKTSENHPFCLFWKARIHLLKNEKLEAAGIFQKNFRKIVDDGTNAIPCERDLVYALLEEKNYEQAKKYALLGYRRIGDPWLPTLTAIASGNLEEAIGWTYDVIEHGYSLKRLYEDELVAEVLKSKSFAKFRKRYPPPVKNLSINP